MNWEIVLSVLIGVGLATACGFKVFVPFLVLSIASISGHLELVDGFAWVGTYPALIAFAIATFLEILAYYIPYIDNILDTIATPVAVVCGVLVMSSCVQDMSPLMRWSLAIIVGGTAAGLTKVTASTVRLSSTAFTGGSGNFAVNTIEIIMSVIMSIVAVIMPVLVVLAVIILIIIFIAIRKLMMKIWKRKKEKGAKK